MRTRAIDCRRAIVAGLIAALFGCASLAHGADRLTRLSDLREGDGRVIVLFADDAADPSAAQPHAQSDAGGWQSLERYIDSVTARGLNEIGWRNLNDIVRFDTIPAIAGPADPGAVRRALRSDRVRAVYHDRLRSTSLVQTLPLAGVPPVHAAGALGGGAAVAVIDTGVQPDHPLLGGRVVAGACFSETDWCPPRPSGSAAGAPCAGNCAHGTHVAGIIGGRSPTLRGVAPQAQLLAVQVFSALGQGRIGARDSDILRGLEWVALHSLETAVPIAAVNLSLGGPAEFPGACDPERMDYALAFDVLETRFGILPVVAAGNEGNARHMSAPACLSGAISVGALDKDGGIAEYSNASPALSILAPGSDVVSAMPGSRLGSLSGTSMAAPHVAGSLAVLRGRFPQAPPALLRQALLEPAPRVTDPRNGRSYPALNLDASVAWLARALGDAPGPAPDPEQEPPPPEPEPVEPPTAPDPVAPGDGLLIEGPDGRKRRIQW